MRIARNVLIVICVVAVLAGFAQAASAAGRTLLVPYLIEGDFASYLHIGTHDMLEKAPVVLQISVLNDDLSVATNGVFYVYLHKDMGGQSAEPNATICFTKSGGSVTITPIDGVTSISGAYQDVTGVSVNACVRIDIVGARAGEVAATLSVFDFTNNMAFCMPVRDKTMLRGTRTWTIPAILSPTVENAVYFYIVVPFVVDGANDADAILLTVKQYKSTGV